MYVFVVFEVFVFFKRKTAYDMRISYWSSDVCSSDLEAGGFDSLILHSVGMIAFDGDVNLVMSQAMTLYAGSVGLAGVAADSQVRLASPYIHLASTDNSGSLGVHYATPNLDNTSQPLIGGLTLEASQLLEVRGGRGLEIGRAHV